ncbi:hypothetical protein [Streptacidiphilus sp. P02-A3a]|uniref:hypothetical protein n=1 Tax=Streptacidiphilus sp. P02-A3a TaxID=2704468 RepID=UPI0015FC5A06|nr:hypothetical protein [Streptacidiphilus sp. P02-A3a]QMU70374.1 hypothetical protein GXP74_21335 [Streptacidiphilus sp. P02-A3a]
MDHASGVTVVLTAADHAVASWMLLAFVVTFVLTRLITRLIRAGRGPFGNVEVGGTHVHHEVYGIMAMLVSGAVEFAYRPQTPGAQILGALFGAGAALTLDEFALWLHLEDVYWAREGRKSVDAVFVAAAAGLFLLIGGNPFSNPDGESHLAFGIALGVNLLLCLGAILKGKTTVGIVGLFVPFLALIGCLRLAKPHSPWARWRYRPDSRGARRAARRYPPGRRTRLDSLKDFLGGTPQDPH